MKKLGLAIALALSVFASAQTINPTQIRGTAIVQTPTSPQVIQNYGVTMPSLNLASSSAAGPSIIYDDDNANDWDGLFELAALMHWHETKQLNVLALITDSSNTYAAPAMRVVRDYYGFPSVPVGAYQGSDDAPGSVSTWTAPLVAQFRPGDVRTNYQDCVTTYRTVLAAAPASSVEIVNTGFLTCIVGLMNSPSDGISPLTGAQLIATKVSALFVASGDYPTGAEWNFQHDAANANYVFTNWKSQNGYPPIYLDGFAQGWPIISGTPTWFPTSNPVTWATVPPQTGTLGTTSNRPSWGEVSLLQMILGVNSSAWAMSANGTNTVDATTGANTWTSSPASGHYYLTTTQSATFYEELIDGQDYIGAMRYIPQMDGSLISGSIQCGLLYPCSTVSQLPDGTFATATPTRLIGNTTGDFAYSVNNTNNGSSGEAHVAVLTGTTIGQLIALSGNYNGIYGIHNNSVQLINRSGNIYFKSGGYLDTNIVLTLTAQGMLSPAGAFGQVNTNPGGATLQASDNFPQTDTTAHRAANLAQTNDATNPFGLFSGITGSATPTARTATLQTGQDFATAAGHLALQPQGGDVTIGSGSAISNSSNVPQTTATAPTGSCTPNGYIAVNVNGVTLHLATCP